jgi:hypothetical protein
MLLSGMSPQNVMIRATQAIGEMYKQGDYFKQARAQGLYRTNFSKTELQEMADWAKQFENDTKGRKFSEFIESSKKFTKYYGLIDDWWKTAKFIDEMKKGRSAKEAAYEANKWAMDYSLTHPFIKKLRNSPFGAPFVTYQYKVAPLLIESAIKRPWVLAGMAMVPFAFEKLITDKMTDAEAIAFRKNLPKYIRDGAGFLIPGYHGVEYMDVTNWLPWGNFMQSGGQVMRGEYGKALREMGFMQSFAPQVANAIMYNQDFRTGKPIVSPLEQLNPKAAAWAVSKYLWTTMMPPMLTEFGAGGKTYEWAKYGQNKRGQPLEWYNAVPRWAGINVNPINPKGKRLEIRHDQKELAQDAYRKMFGTKDPEERIKIRESLKQGLEKIRSGE